MGASGNLFKSLWLGRRAASESGLSIQPACDNVPAFQPHKVLLPGETGTAEATLVSPCSSRGAAKQVSRREGKRDANITISVCVTRTFPTSICT